MNRHASQAASVARDAIHAKQSSASKIEKEIEQAKKKGKQHLKRHDRKVCWRNIWSWFFERRVGRAKHSQLQEESMESAFKKGSSEYTPWDMHKSLFGVSAKNDNKASTERLTRMAETSRNSSELLEQEADRDQKAAAHFFRQGNKQRAIRMLKKSKTTRARAFSLASAAETLEAQVSLLQQTELQRSVAEAIKSAGVSGMSMQRALGQLESAADDAHELRDTVQDAELAMNEVASTALGPDLPNDEDLIEELTSMIAEKEDESRQTTTVTPAQVPSHKPVLSSHGAPTPVDAAEKAWNSSKPLLSSA